MYTVEAQLASQAAVISASRAKLAPNDGDAVIGMIKLGVQPFADAWFELTYQFSWRAQGATLPLTRKLVRTGGKKATS